MSGSDAVHVERLAPCAADTYRVGRICYSCSSVDGTAGAAIFFVTVPLVLALAL